MRARGQAPQRPVVPTLGVSALAAGRAAVSRSRAGGPRRLHGHPLAVRASLRHPSSPCCHHPRRDAGGGRPRVAVYATIVVLLLAPPLVVALVYVVRYVRVFRGAGRSATAGSHRPRVRSAPPSRAPPTGRSLLRLSACLGTTPTRAGPRRVHPPVSTRASRRRAGARRIHVAAVAPVEQRPVPPTPLRGLPDELRAEARRLPLRAPVANVPSSRRGPHESDPLSTGGRGPVADGEAGSTGGLTADAGSPGVAPEDLAATPAGLAADAVQASIATQGSEAAAPWFPAAPPAASRRAPRPAYRPPAAARPAPRMSAPEPVASEPVASRRPPAMRPRPCPSTIAILAAVPLLVLVASGPTGRRPSSPV